MNVLLVLAFLFSIGSCFGWVLEVFFRKWFSGENPEHKWINPGFCVGPYLPIYGTGLCVMFIMACLGNEKGISATAAGTIIWFTVMALAMTLIEYIAGYVCDRHFHIKLWDYSRQWGNINGYVCPLFSFFWAVLGAAYYFGIHPHILESLNWLSNNLAFSFFIGLFFGVFIIDVVYSANLVSEVRKFAEEKQIVVRYERFKTAVREKQTAGKEMLRFFIPFGARRIAEILKEASEELSELTINSIRHK